MPRTPRSPKSIESFGPEVLQALIEGSKRELVLPLPYRKAVFFRQRINSLRAEMRRQNHEMLPVVSQATVRVVWGLEAGFADTPEKRSSTNVRFPANKSTPAKLIISPPDHEFGEALKKAGVEVKGLTSTSGSGTETATTPIENDILAQIMKEEEPSTEVK